MLLYHISHYYYVVMAMFTSFLVDVHIYFQHISTKTSKPGPVAFCEIEIYSFEVFGTFQLSFAYQSATKAVQSCHKLGINPMGSISRLWMNSLGNFWGIFLNFLQQKPVLSDIFFSFCLIWKTSNQVLIEKSWNCNGNLLWHFVPYYWVLWKPVFQRASQNVKIGFHCF